MHFRSSRGFMHMRIQESQTAEGPSYILGQFSKPFRYTKCNVQTGAYKQSVSLIIFCCLGKVAYSATIGWFLKKICFKFSYKRSPTIWHFWDIWKYITFKEKTLGLFSPTFGKFGILLIPSSGHTGSLLYWRPCLLWSERWNMKSMNAAFLSFLKSKVQCYIPTLFHAKIIHIFVNSRTVPLMVQYYTENRLPIKGAEHTYLKYPVVEELLWVVNTCAIFSEFKSEGHTIKMFENSLSFQFYDCTYYLFKLIPTALKILTKEWLCGSCTA